MRGFGVRSVKFDVPASARYTVYSIPTYDGADVGKSQKTRTDAGDTGENRTLAGAPKYSGCQLITPLCAGLLGDVPDNGAGAIGAIVGDPGIGADVPVVIVGEITTPVTGAVIGVAVPVGEVNTPVTGAGCDGAVPPGIRKPNCACPNTRPVGV